MKPSEPPKAGDYVGVGEYKGYVVSCLIIDAEDELHWLVTFTDCKISKPPCWFRKL